MSLTGCVILYKSNHITWTHPRRHREARPRAPRFVIIPLIRASVLHCQGKRHGENQDGRDDQKDDLHDAPLTLSAGILYRGFRLAFRHFAIGLSVRYLVSAQPARFSACSSGMNPRLSSWKSNEFDPASSPNALWGTDGFQALSRWVEPPGRACRDLIETRRVERVETLSRPGGFGCRVGD